MKKQVLFFMMMLLSIIANAETVEINGIYYNLDDYNQAEVTRHPDNYSGEIVIPESVTYNGVTYTVCIIGKNAFRSCKVTSVTIPNSVSVIGSGAFMYSSIKSITIPNSVSTIGDSAFSKCKEITSIILPNDLTILGDYAFEGCSNLTSVTIPSSLNVIGEGVFRNSGLTSINIPIGVYSIGKETFCQCYSLTSVTLPTFMVEIGERAFSGCSGLSSIIIPKTVLNIGRMAFYGCTGLSSIIIPNSVRTIGNKAFDGVEFTTIISMIDDPFKISGLQSEEPVFNEDTFQKATLYVPVGTIEKYKSTEGWSDFLFIKEGVGPQCAKPTISYKNGKLSFNCETEGATYLYSITDDDIKSGSSSEVQLGVTYNIRVYATKAGYQNSETATATLCWIDVEPKTEGITDNVANVRAKAVMIQSNGGELNIFGADEGTAISVFDASGKMVGSAKASAGTTIISTSLSNGEIGIVKIGDKSIKVLMK